MTNFPHLLAHSGETHFNTDNLDQSPVDSTAPVTGKSVQTQIQYIDPIEHSKLLNSWYADPIFLFVMVVSLFYLKGFTGFRSIRRITLSYANLTCYLLGVFTLFIALCSPLDLLADFSFLMHMIQHILLIQVAAPLFCASAIHVLIMKGFDKNKYAWVWYKFLGARTIQRIFRLLISPVFAIIFFNASFWFWHIPYFYNLAIQNEYFHNLEHMMFFYSGIVYWWSIFTPGAAPKFSWLLKMLWIIISMMISGILAALINFTDKPLYLYYDNIRVFGLDPLTDQQVGALFMWVPGSVIYFILMAFVFFKGFKEETDKNPTYLSNSIESSAA